MKKNKFTDIIKTLKTGGFYTECPCCDDELALKDIDLFDNDNFTEEALQYYQNQLLEIKERKADLKARKEKGTTKSETGAKSVNLGFILERLAPTLGSFRFNQNDCRSMFDPIDYVIFDGLSKKGQVDKIFFIDIKTGNARLSKKQKEIRTVIEENKVKFKTY